jgi:hypothetical protein
MKLFEISWLAISSETIRKKRQLFPFSCYTHRNKFFICIQPVVFLLLLRTYVCKSSPCKKILSHRKQRCLLQNMEQSGTDKIRTTIVRSWHSHQTKILYSVQYVPFDRPLLQEFLDQARIGLNWCFDSPDKELLVLLRILTGALLQETDGGCRSLFVKSRGKVRNWLFVFKVQNKILLNLPWKFVRKQVEGWHTAHHRIKPVCEYLASFSAGEQAVEDPCLLRWQSKGNKWRKFSNIGHSIPRAAFLAFTKYEQVQKGE